MEKYFNGYLILKLGLTSQIIYNSCFCNASHKIDQHFDLYFL